MRQLESYSEDEDGWYAPYPLQDEDGDGGCEGGADQDGFTAHPVNPVAYKGTSCQGSQHANAKDRTNSAYVSAEVGDVFCQMNHKRVGAHVAKQGSEKEKERPAIEFFLFIPGQLHILPS